MSRLTGMCSACGKVFYVDLGHACPGPRRATQSAAARHASARTTATRYPNLCDKDGPVIHIMPHLGAFWRQRHADRQRITALEDHARITDVVLQALGQQVAQDSLLLGTTAAPDYGPPAGHPEAEQLPLGAQDDAVLTVMASGPDLWPNDEWEQITAEGDLLPVMGGPVFTCWCGAQASNGTCPLGHRS